MYTCICTYVHYPINPSPPHFLLQVLLFIPLGYLRKAWRSTLVVLQLRSHSGEVETEHTDYVEDDPLDAETTRRAQVLWMKSLTRLRTQVRV